MMMASALTSPALASFFSESPGMNSIDRKIMGLLHFPWGPLGLPLHQRRTLAYPHQFVALVEAAVGEDHDAVVGAGFALPQFQDLGLDVDGVAVEQGLG